MTGRTTSVWTRVYDNGYDVSGYTRSISPLQWEFETAEEQTLADSIKGGLPGLATIGVGTINATFDNTDTIGMHVLNNTPGSLHTLMIPIGFRAAPALGDPCFVGEFEHKSYMTDNGGVMTNATLAFENSIRRAQNYPIPWGWLLHPKGAETAVNTSTGWDEPTAAATTSGGYMCYQVFAGDGTATIKVQDAATNSNPSFSDVSGLTTGSINCSTPKHGMVALATTATVRRYTRWQIVLGTATTVTFALAFVRGYQA